MDLATRKDFERIVAEAVPPPGTTDVVAVVEHTPGEKIAGSDYYAGRGGQTAYGAAWFIDGRVPHKPAIALFANQKDCYELIRLLTGEGSELGDRKEARRRRIIELEEIERTQEAEAKAEAKEQAKTLRRAKRNGVDLTEALVGGGSSRPSRSSAKPTDTKPRQTRLVRRKA